MPREHLLHTPCLIALQVDFKAPVVGPQQQALQLQKEQEPSGQQEQKQ